MLPQFLVAVHIIGFLKLSFLFLPVVCIVSGAVSSIDTVVVIVFGAVYGAVSGIGTVVCIVSGAVSGAVSGTESEFVDV